MRGPVSIRQSHYNFAIPDPVNDCMCNPGTSIKYIAFAVLLITSVETLRMTRVIAISEISRQSFPGDETTLR